MIGFKRSSSNSLFRIQQNGRFGVLSMDGTETELEQFVASKTTGHDCQGRGPVPLTTSIPPKRLRLGAGIVCIVMMLFIGRSAHLQVVRGEYYTALSSRNKERVELLLPARGLISANDGTLLAWNEPAFVLTMTASDLPQGEKRDALFARVANLIGIQPTDLDLLLSRYATHPYDAIPIADDLKYESAIRLAIEVSNLPGFSLSTRTKRIYSSSASSLSHLLGYTGALNETDFEEHYGEGYRLIDSIGKVGIEREYESLLRGIPGKLIYEVDSLGQELSILSKEEPVSGSNLTLTINVEFQKFIETQLEATFARVGVSRGSVVALDPYTGAVHALVSLPAYDINEFSEGISSQRYAELIEDEDNPLFFRAISGEFPSGSTFKPMIAYAALAEGIVDEHTSFVSNGGLRIGQWFFPDWKAGGHGVTDARKAISESVNTYFYIIGGGFDTVTGLGVERIVDYAQRFGFGSQTGIDLPSESNGFLPSEEWKEDVKGERWYVGDTYHLAIGQGDLLITPLQMAVATGVIASSGEKITPYIVGSADGFGTELLAHDTPVEIKGLDANALSIVRQGMRQTVTGGSARSLSTLSEAVAGKTGTAQTPGDRPYHSWFTGFGPYENPSIVLVVLIEEGGESNDAAVPLARQILDWWFLYGQ